MAKKEIKHFDLSKIENPNFVKKLTYKELDVLCDDIRQDILKNTSKNGGHIASNLGVVEATVSLCRCFDFSKDKLIFDVGHQCYTYKILTGRSLEKLRKKDGISGFPKMSESPFDHFETGHSSTSISIADGMAIARGLNKEKFDVIAFIGDSSISNGLAFEALNNLAEDGHKVIIVLNDNNMSISKPVGAISKLFRNFSTSAVYLKGKHVTHKILQKFRSGRWLIRQFTKVKNWLKKKLLNITIFDNLGFSVIGPIDGHYIKQLDKAFNKAKKMNKSVIVHIKTIKGKGYSYAENDECGDWHGVSRFNIETGEIVSKEGFISWSEQYKNVLKDNMASNNKIVTVVPATGHGSALDELFTVFPNRIFDVGIAEEHAVTISGGLAVSNIHPVIFVYSTFLQRAYDQISHDLARMNLNTTLLIDRAGLVGSDGDTHQGIYDEAFLYTIPNVTIAMASRASESKDLFKESLNNHGVFAIRLPREDVFTKNKVHETVKYGTWKQETIGNKGAIVSVGPMTLYLKKIIKENSLDIALYNAIYQKPMDENKILELLNYPKIVIYNVYATKEGFANALAVKLLELGYKGKVIIKCVKTDFIKQGTIDEQRIDNHLSPEEIIEIF